MDDKNEYLLFLVDDDIMFRSLLKNCIQQQFGSGLKISEYYSGEKCIENINKLPNIIILDYYLNEENTSAMNGLHVLREIRTISKDIIVIMISGQDKLNIAIDCLRHGAYEYIAKSESTFVRIQNSIKNAIESINSKRENKKYFKINIKKTYLIIAILLIDMVWYCLAHY